MGAPVIVRALAVLALELVDMAVMVAVFVWLARR